MPGWSRRALLAMNDHLHGLAAAALPMTRLEMSWTTPQSDRGGLRQVGDLGHLDVARVVVSPTVRVFVSMGMFSAVRETGEMPSALNRETMTWRPASAQAMSAWVFRDAVAPATSREANRMTARPITVMTRTTRTDRTRALPRSGSRWHGCSGLHRR